MEDEEIAPILYPAYIEQVYKDKNLAYFYNYQLVTERGDIHIVTDFSTFVQKIFELNLLVFMLHIPSFPWLEEVIHYQDKAMCSKDGKPLSIRIKGARNTSRMIVNAASWGYDGTKTDAQGKTVDYSPLDWLQTMRSVYEIAAVGTPGSPGSVGQALFRKSFKEQHGDNWKEARHRRPPVPYCEKIKGEASGARSEVFQLNVSFARAYENDQHNGYGFALSHAQPTGKTYRVSGKSVLHCKVYFVECEVTIHHDLGIGIFPVRVGRGTNRSPAFPVAIGVYSSWLWDLEIETARKEGLTVVVKHGFGWKETTTDFKPFVETVARMRETAPPKIQGYFKLILVAAVGHLGMPTERYKLVEGKDREVGDVCVSDAAMAYDWWVHQEIDPYPQSMPHIFYHTLMLCRLSLYHMAKLCIEQELNIIATNTDAVITEKRLDTLPVKGTHVETGEWTHFELHNVLVPANRHLISDEKIATPGIPKKRKV